MAVGEVLQHIAASQKTKKDMCVLLLLDGECGLGDGQSAGVSTCRGLENKRMTVRMSLWRDTFDHPTSPPTPSSSSSTQQPPDSTTTHSP